MLYGNVMEDGKKEGWELWLLSGFGLLGEVIEYLPCTKIIADYANLEKQVQSFCVVGNLVFKGE